MNRIIVNKEGEAWTLERAAQKGIHPEIAFKRDDGWILCAPKQFEGVAYKMWPYSWTHYSRKEWSNTGEIIWKPISKYGLE